MAAAASRLGPICVAVRIMTRPAPERVPRGALALAHGKLLDMTSHFHRRIFRRPNEVGYVLSQSLAGAERGKASSGALDPGLTRQMALRADRVALFWCELFGIGHTHGGIPDVLATRTMTSLAGDTVIEKGRIGVPILRAVNRLEPAGMTGKAGGIDGPVEPNLALLFVAGGGVPGTLLLVPGHRQLKQISPRGGIAELRAD